MGGAFDVRFAGRKQNRPCGVVDVDMTLMLKDVQNARESRPFVFVSKKDKNSLLSIKEWIEALM
jgi:Ni2+-binding GTPase involved in maturation of urease and hydrogenase